VTGANFRGHCRNGSIIGATLAPTFTLATVFADLGHTWFGLAAALADRRDLAS